MVAGQIAFGDKFPFQDAQKTRSGGKDFGHQAKLTCGNVSQAVKYEAS
jgi:hypothetical protein